jgi:hypothetical protein
MLAAVSVVRGTLEHVSNVYHSWAGTSSVKWFSRAWLAAAPEQLLLHGRLLTSRLFAVHQLVQLRQK